MKWTEQHDVSLCREVLVVQPFQWQPKTQERGQAWTKIANELNAINHLRFTVNQKSVRDRLKLLIQRFKRKTRDEERETGINPDETELDMALEEIVDLTDEANQEYEEESEKKKKKLEDDRKKAEELRQRSLETLGETRKRSPEDKVAKRKNRKDGTETLAYLKHKCAKDFEMRRAELDLKKDELNESKSMANAMQEQQQQMIQFQKNMIEQSQQQQGLMLQFLQQQALQHQQFLATQAQQQQQNNQLLLALLGKVNPK